MRPIQQLVHSRTRVCSNYALMPLEGFPISRLPNWNGEVRVLASPTLGANFVQYLIDLGPGGCGYFPAEDDIETFYFTLSGKGFVDHGADASIDLTYGSYGLVPPGTKCEFGTTTTLKLLFLRKRYEPYHIFQIGKGAQQNVADRFEPLHGQESKVAKQIWGDNPHSLLQTLIPDDLAYDMAMNIFTFDPGHGLPIVETHVMEHGLFFQQGKGMYFLNDTWMEVEANDFIWMGPYCPQSFYATGPTPSRYLYYKNVNREIPL
jgi:(S)-ureidoglycine aminohydrolase